jgi:transposase InsO family protein
MYMPYTTYPRQPQIRRDAVRFVAYRGWSMRKVARHLGVEPSTVSRWVKLDPTGGWRLIPTQSCRPHRHPAALGETIVDRILALRGERGQCAEVLHHRLSQEGTIVSLSSVKRVLKRHGLTRFSRWKKWHQYPSRPLPERPGLLVQIDTILDGIPEERLNVYTGLDVCSRFAFALPTERINTHASWRFVQGMRHESPFAIALLQSDHGAEFSKWFTKQCASCGLAHRHSRVRRPTDNGHLERFNRTIQEECLNSIPRSLQSWRKEIPEFLHYYNEQRPHMGLDMKTPLEVLRSY